MTERWMVAVGDADTLRDAVIARFEAGPFKPVAAGEPWLRQIEIGDSFVRELGDRVVGEFLARHLATVTREPTRLQVPDFGLAFEFAPDDDPAASSREVEPEARSIGEPVHRLYYALDLDKQRELSRAFERDVERRITAQFPLQNRRKTARLDCKKLAAYGPTTSPDEPAAFRYDRYLQADIQLALFEWSADGNDRTMTELRKGSVTLGRYDLLTPPGHIVVKGERIVVPYDEYAAEFHAGMTRYLRLRVREALERTDWKNVKPESLFD